MEYANLTDALCVAIAELQSGEPGPVEMDAETLLALLQDIEGDKVHG